MFIFEKIMRALLEDRLQHTSNLDCETLAKFQGLQGELAQYDVSYEPLRELIGQSAQSGETDAMPPAAKPEQSNWSNDEPAAPVIPEPNEEEAVTHEESH